MSHKHDCPTARPPHDYALCTCPGGSELQFADWDELKPLRHYTIPERHYERH